MKRRLTINPPCREFDLFLREFQGHVIGTGVKKQKSALSVIEATTILPQSEKANRLTSIMHPVLLVAFQFQIQQQCEYILLAFTELENASRGRDFPRVFFAAQNLLTAAANVSKALWGTNDLKQGAKAKQDRKPLRDSIQVTDASPLRNVVMRNHYEHFDERIDKWFRTSKSHQYVDFTIGNPFEFGPAGMGNFRDTDVFRSYDPQTKTLYFWGHEFRLQEIVNEVNRILPILEEESQKPRWTEVH